MSNECNHARKRKESRHHDCRAAKQQNIALNMYFLVIHAFNLLERKEFFNAHTFYIVFIYR